MEISETFIKIILVLAVLCISASLAIYGTKKTYFSSYMGDDEFLKLLSKKEVEKLNSRENKKDGICAVLFIIGFVLFFIFASYYK